MAKTIKGTTIIVKCEHLTAPRVRMTARKDITFTSQDGTVKATVKAGETFYLAKSDTHEGFYYLVTSDVNSSTCWRCSCPAFKPCKHEKTCQADNNARFTISPIEAHIKYTAATAGQPEDNSYSTLSPSQRQFMARCRQEGPRKPQRTVGVYVSSVDDLPSRAVLNGRQDGRQGFSMFR